MATSSSSPSSSSSSLPVGYRFHPTEEELVNHYLKKKIHGKDFNDVIPEIDICGCEPWDLPGFSKIRSDDEEWYYFSRPDYKSGNKGRANRATDRGFWKITGREREIKARESKAVIGKKRTLTFYTGKVRSGRKTGWVIHEYYIPETLLPTSARQRDFVLCRLKKKDESTDIGACDEGEPSTNNASDFQNLMAVFGTQSIPEDFRITLQQDTRPEQNLAKLFPSPESPQSHYFSSMLRDNLLHANVGSDDRLELLPLGPDDAEDEELFADSLWVEEDDYFLEERSRTTLLNHSSEPKSLRMLYAEGIQQQGMSSPVASGLSVRDKMLLNFLLQKNASSVKIAANMPRNIGRVQSGRLEESKSEARYEVLQSGFGSVSDQSSSNENERRKGEMVAAVAGPALPLRRDDHNHHPIQHNYVLQCKLPEPEKPKSPEKPMSAPRNDEGKGMKQKQTRTTITDRKSSFIVWKDSPLSLGSYPPVVYIVYFIGGLFMFIFFLGELLSYWRWY